MVTSLYGNSNRKLRSTFWGSLFIPVGTNQTECCVPFTNFSVPSRLQTHATEIPTPPLDSNRNGYGNSAVNWSIAYHYHAFDIPAGFFCQMVSTPAFALLEVLSVFLFFTFASVTGLTLFAPERGFLCSLFTVHLFSYYSDRVRQWNKSHCGFIDQMYAVDYSNGWLIRS